ncbi:hypothetical protein ACFPT7_11645 [Acidicapsa dinghuensis]|uniref:Uncharacterized protein n=1 Tax=Acidicapsa dinghuensis TaxID=2218256 RepID=A0ABW1EJ02_9BACT|nr:hypothetical protein [Acidicapsa dinghuensis]
MSKLTINAMDIQSMEANVYLNVILNVAKRYLSTGGRVVIQEGSDNAPPTLIRQFTALAEFESFIKSLATSTVQSLAYSKYLSS